MIPIFVAIDTPSYFAAEDLLYALGDEVHIKIGLEFFVANGPDACMTLRDKGATVPRQLFLDLKFHDIPNTVAGAVRSAMALEPDFLTLHTCDGVSPLLAAVEAVDKYIGKRRPKLLGVTVLTSSYDSDNETFETRIIAASSAGLAGIICPPSRIKSIRNEWHFIGWSHETAFLMVPGIRMENSSTHDQRNVSTPRQAMLDGADALVIGRDITNTKDPLKAVLAIKESMM